MSAQEGEAEGYVSLEGIMVVKEKIGKHTIDSLILLLHFRIVMHFKPIFSARLKEKTKFGENEFSNMDTYQRREKLINLGRTDRTLLLYFYTHHK